MKILCKKTISGFVPFGDSEFEKFKKFKHGDVYEVDIKMKRNYKFHKKFFALINLTHMNQDYIDSFEHFRSAVTIEAGFFEWVKLLDGTEQKKAKSISFSRMDQAEFEEVYNRVFDVCLKILGLKSEELEQEILAFTQ